MTLKELYDSVGGNYEEVMGRMLKEERVTKFVGMFLRDPSFQQLMDAMVAGDYEEAFKGAHTLKGVCGNLSLTRLATVDIEVTEALRGGANIELAKELLPGLESCYRETIAQIQAYVDEQA